MSTNRINTPGFGVGASFGIPTTLGLAPTSTLSITSGLVGSYYATGLVTGTNLTLVSTSNGVTGTYTILSGAPGHVWLDGASAFAVSTTTSVSLVFIAD
jgi:hypothetical protein